MKRVVTLVALLAISVAGWVWLSRHGGRTKLTSSASPEQYASDAGRTTASLLTNDLGSTIDDLVGKARMAMKPLPPARSGAVEFHAQVRDQAGVSASGVKFHIRISSSRDGDNEETALVSDTEGRVSLRGKRADWLRILNFESTEFILPGDEDPMIYPEHWVFGYGGHSDKRGTPYTDPKRPFPIPAWRKKGGEPNVRVSRVVKFAAIGETHELNAFGAATAGGEREYVDFSIGQKGLEPPDVSPPFDHKLVIEVRGGGVVETDSFFPYGAPASGYQPRLEFIVQPDDTVFREGRWKRRLYLKLRGGRLYVGLLLKYDGRVEIHSIVNPSGSTNLEPDPSKQITDPEELRRLDVETAK